QLRGKYYYAKYRDSDGNQHCVSTKLGKSDRKAAQKLATQWEDASRNDVVAKQQHKIYSDLLLAKGQFTSVNQYVGTWLKAVSGSLSPASRVKYELGANKLLAFLGPRVSLPMCQISKSELVDYRQSLLEGAGAVSVKTAENNFDVVKMIWRAAAGDDVI